MLFKLNSVQFDRSGDGFKNYFSFAYQYKYGEGLWFEGMQYPYGDLLSYADGQPALLLTCKFLKKIGLDFTGHELFVIQFLPIVSLLVCAFFLHKIMRHFDQPRWWTFLSVVSCIALSPQIYRFNSHFALAYAFCFPAVWYFLILYKDKKISPVLFMTVSTLFIYFTAQLHPYHLLLSSLFLMAYFLAEALHKKLDIWVIAVAILPLLIFLITNQILDPYIDRPKNPWGAWHYKTEISDFFPFYGWFNNLFGKLLNLRTDYTEGYCYLSILLILSPILYFIRKYKVESFGIKPSYKKYLMASFFVLLFAMAVHMLLTGKQINEWISTLKQFRALGRFSWAFYYIGFIGLAIIAHNAISTYRSIKIRYAIYVFILLFWISDIHSYHTFYNKKINHFNAPNELVNNRKIYNVIEKSPYSFDHFQALLTLPVSTEGAEKLGVEDNWFVKTESIPFVMQTATPLVGAYMSRTSLSRIVKQLQLSSSDYIKKEALSDFKSQKDLLVVVNKEDKSIFADIISKSYYIGETKENLIFGLTMEALGFVKKIKRDSFKANSNALFYNDFSKENTTGLLSKGAYKVNGSNYKLINLVSDTLVNDTLTFSIWYRIDIDKSTTPFFNIVFKDQSGKTLKTVNYRDSNIKRFEVLDQWFKPNMRQ